jgi:hypothetical protein
MIITNNAAGLATNVKTEFNGSGSNWDNQAFEYSGNELIKGTFTNSSGTTPSINLVTWDDGNMKDVSSGGTISTIDYYFDKPSQDGDYLVLSQLVQGYQIYRSKNLIKSILTGNIINSFTYTFDADGKITSVTSTAGATPTTLNFQYQCD